ncbi:unnamed protein product, partial [marine sediment metagenome]
MRLAIDISGPDDPPGIVDIIGTGQHPTRSQINAVVKVVHSTVCPDEGMKTCRGHRSAHYLTWFVNGISLRPTPPERPQIGHHTILPYEGMSASGGPGIA